MPIGRNADGDLVGPWGVGPRPERWNTPFMEATPEVDRTLRLIEDVAERVAPTLAALGVPGRVEVLLHVAGGVSMRAGLADLMNVTVATVTRYANQLERFGLLSKGKEGQTRPLTLTPLGLAAVEAVRGLAK